MPDGVPMREAAAHLGVSVAAVRQRIRRGSLDAFKGDDGRWFVRIPVVPPPVPDAVPHDIPRETPDQVADLREQVAYLREQINVKDMQIVVKDEQIRELHVLLQTSQRQIPATSSPQPPREAVAGEEAKSSIPPPDRAQRGAERVLRGFWKRIIGEG